MATKRKPISIDWCPKDALDGMQDLSPWEELAYRRILDMIYAGGNQLRDDPERLAWSTKVGRRWPKIRATLIERGKIEVVDGVIRNSKCDFVLDRVRTRIEQKRLAGKARWMTPDELINALETNDTRVAAASPPHERNESETTPAASPPHERYARAASNQQEEEEPRAPQSASGSSSGWESESTQLAGTARDDVPLRSGASRPDDALPHQADGKPASEPGAAEGDSVPFGLPDLPACLDRNKPDDGQGPKQVGEVLDSLGIVPAAKLRELDLTDTPAVAPAEAETAEKFNGTSMAELLTANGVASGATHSAGSYAKAWYANPDGERIPVERGAEVSGPWPERIG